MTRSQLLQRLLDLFEKPAYLEVGVSHGVTFLGLKADRKVAVDPKFHFDFEAAAASDASAYFHEITSHRYFTAVMKPREKFDVIFLDGLHTFEQTLDDFCNAVMCLKEDGIIVIDDVVPSSYHASLKDHRLSVQLRNAVGKDVHDKSWMGDVYRLVFFIAFYFHQFSFATVKDNHGQLVVWRQQRDAQEAGSRSVEAIARLPFEASYLEQTLYNFRPFAEIIEMVKTARR